MMKTTVARIIALVLMMILAITVIYAIETVLTRAIGHAEPSTVVYSVTADNLKAPTLLMYWHAGDKNIYDSLNSDHLDGDTMPWVYDAGTQGPFGVRAGYWGSGQPWPTYTCTITVNGVVQVQHTNVGGVTCNLGF